MLRRPNIQILIRFITIISLLLVNSILSQHDDSLFSSNSSTQRCVGGIGDFIWHDSNVDGIQDEDEFGIEGVIIELFDSSKSLIDTIVSDENGNYLFSNLATAT